MSKLEKRMAALEARVTDCEDRLCCIEKVPYIDDRIIEHDDRLKSLEARLPREQAAPAPDYRVSERISQYHGDVEPCSCEETEALRTWVRELAAALNRQEHGSARRESDLQRQLAAANALLEECRSRQLSLPAALIDRIGVHLSAQSAAPTDHDDCDNEDRQLCHHVRPLQRRAPTDHDRAVLEAMARIPAESFEWCDGISVSLDEAIKAELARREAKR